ncbi:multidrug effflux MFS transporter [Aliikangiella coralliicola]|uniref:Bcr/CflA family efflux transporter n=1 Tax=Aliikangiella coralliicola TaxID=2592383 RepID=A0A545UFW9_9GAMM|nr:multidrug effflux MFS transporter [Aliikangiella coralliicola]TQV88370.1 multidrug effflux MFS transporter [Aliikangiella coralliicola]
MRYLPLFAAIFAITPLAIDLYLPAMLQIADSLNTDIRAIQNSLSIYLAGYAGGMFLFGPLADRIGRRPLLIAGLFGFVTFTVLLVFVQQVELFLIFRLLQAVSGGAATVVIPGAIRQLFGKDTAKGLSYVSMIMMVAPMVAPALGSYLMLLDDWRLIFQFLGVYGAIMLIVASIFFPKLEAARNDGKNAPSVSFINSYRLVLSNKLTQGYLAVSMLASFVFFTYITSVSFLYIQVLGFSEAQFSWLFGANVGGLILASFINTRLVPRFGSPKILKNSVIVVALLAGLFFAAVIAQVNVMIIVSLLLMVSTIMIISANSDAIILQQFSQQTGTATAVIGTLRFGSGALGGPLLALFFDGTANPVAYLIVTAVSVMVVCFLAHYYRSKPAELVTA